MCNDEPSSEPVEKETRESHIPPNAHVDWPQHVSTVEPTNQHTSYGNMFGSRLPEESNVHLRIR